MLQLFQDLENGRTLVYPEMRGLLRIFGTDAKSFLQRMSTNDMEAIGLTHPIQSSFTNNKGRLIEHAMIFELAREEYVLVTSAPHHEILANWLEQFHFVEDLTIDRTFTAQVTLIIASKLEPKSNPCMSPFWQAKLHNGMSIQFILGMNLEKMDDAVQIEEDSLKTLRIASLLPAYPNEINEAFMPHNVNLGQFIADNKGCFIGQEVISKARLYQKHEKRLSGVFVSKTEWETLREGAPFKGATGLVTSVAPIYVEHEANALKVSSLDA